MSDLPRLFLVRHGETAWSLSRQYTGHADIPLTPRGERDAIELAHKLHAFDFERVLASPLQRARRTCELAGFAGAFTLDPDLMEWHYGQYEGRRSAEIRTERPGWNIFDDGAPGGESPEAVSARADRVIDRLRPLEGDTLLFSHGHFLRVLAARWLGLPARDGRLFALDTTTLSLLSYEHERTEPVLLRWNA